MNPQTVNFGEDAEEREPACTAGGTHVGATAREDGVEVPQTPETRTTTCEQSHFWALA